MEFVLNSEKNNKTPASYAVFTLYDCPNAACLMKITFHKVKSVDNNLANLANLANFAVIKVPSVFHSLVVSTLLLSHWKIYASFFEL